MVFIHQISEASFRGGAEVNFLGGRILHLPAEQHTPKDPFLAASNRVLSVSLFHLSPFFAFLPFLSSFY